ncbi:ankyrin repeat [Pyrenophora seminiperda CCB06]|uniref:Ankyrin repeat n=1 Tax=Pyrenophora seminiperda CCB06 TaxID=1302712 RepID=A0A3M7M5W0_9PLEO|nr:ankyrin repeat [Pyrenophora seminiperda CCB06]
MKIITSTTMALLDLPPEIFQRIIAEHIKKYGVVAAWKLRGLSKAFRHYIDYEVLATPKLNAYLKHKAGRTILRNNMARFLFLRSHRLNGFVRDLVPNFIRDVMQRAESWISDDQARVALRRVLCELYVETDDLAYALITKGVEQTRWYQHVENIQVAKVINLIAAAAAAGSIEALRGFANHNHQLLWQYSPTFGYPIVAAAYAGQFEVVKALAEQAVTDKGLPSVLTHSTGEHSAFKHAICTAIEQGHDEMAKVLIENHGRVFGLATESCMAKWLDCAVTAGNKVITRLLQHIPNHGGEGLFYSAFRSSCKLENPDIIRIFFDEKRLEINGVTAKGYPLRTAIMESYKSAVSVRALLALGANPDGPVYPGAFDRPLQVSLKMYRHQASIALLDAGANIHLIPDSVWFPYKKTWSNTLGKLEFGLICSFMDSPKPKPLQGELFASARTEGDV